MRVVAALAHRRRKRAGTMQRIRGNDAAFQTTKGPALIPATLRCIAPSLAFHSFAAMGARTAYAFSAPTVRHSEYVGTWLEVPREDNRAIVRAASRVTNAVDQEVA